MLFYTSTIWLVGHSLGGPLASLLGTTFGQPTVNPNPGSLCMEQLAMLEIHLSTTTKSVTS